MTDDLSFVNGRIWTGACARAGSLTVKDGRIASVRFGTDAAPAARTIDLDGAVVMPGFADGHAHPVFGGTEPALAPVRQASTIEGVAQAVAEWAAANPEVRWVQGWGYNPAITPDGCFAARWLDEVVADRPVVLRAEDYHTVWCNSEALRLAGIDEATPDPPDGRIVRDHDGRPLGTLREWGAVRMVLDLIGAPSLNDRRAALARGLSTLAASGVTWVQDAWVDADDLELYLDASRDGGLEIRVNLALRAEPGAWREQREAFHRARAQVAELGDPLLTCQTVKFFIDGCIELGTAHVLEPYLGTEGDVGLAIWEPDEIAAAASTFDADGFQLHIHAIGDAGVRGALDAVEAVAAANGPRDRRPVIAHAQLVAPEDIARFGALGVIADYQPSWAQPTAVQTVLSVPRLGRARADLQYPIRSVLNSGGRVSFGSDWPCGPHAPLGGVRTVVTRTTRGGGVPWVPDQRITVAQAVEAYTASVAHQAFAEDEWGTLRDGRSADLTVLGDDPVAVEPETVADLPVLATYVAGRPVYDALG